MLFFGTFIHYSDHWLIDIWFKSSYLFNSVNWLEFLEFIKFKWYFNDFTCDLYMWNVFESMWNTNQQTELSLVEKWNSLCNLLTWIIWSTCCVKLCIVWPRNNDYIASVQCLLPESTLKACTVLTNFENFGFLFPMALVCSVPCSCDRQSNWNLDWKFMSPLVRKSVINYVVIDI